MASRVLPAGLLRVVLPAALILAGAVFAAPSLLAQQTQPVPPKSPTQLPPHQCERTPPVTS